MVHDRRVGQIGEGVGESGEGRHVDRTLLDGGVLGKAPTQVLGARQPEAGSSRVERSEHIVGDVSDQQVAHFTKISYDIGTASPPPAA